MMTNDSIYSHRGAYSALYLEDAMTNLGDFFDYAINDYGAEADEVADLFLISSLCRAFERGEAWAVAGMSGYELFAHLSRERGYENHGFIAPRYHPSKTPEYWAGSTCAYIQWRLDLTFDELLRIVPFTEFIGLYSPWHEASEERMAQLVCETAAQAPRKTALARLRQNAGLSQRELAHRSGVSLRSIQMYEQRNKDINKAHLETVRALARALHCPIEALFEPNLTVENAA